MAIPALAFIFYFRKYKQLEGMAYRIVPVRSDGRQEQGFVHKGVLYDNLIHRFSYRNLDREDVFLDKNYLRSTAGTREKFALLAEAYLQEGNVEKAKEVVDFCLAKIPLDTVPADFYTPRFIPVVAAAGQSAQATDMFNSMARES